MTLASVKRHEDKELRGRILKALDFSFPAPISFKMLSYALKSARYDCSSAQLKAHLAYLKEKGYVMVEKVGVEDLDIYRDMVKLTVHGKDLVEGNIENEPGVIIYE